MSPPSSKSKKRAGPKKGPSPNKRPDRQGSDPQDGPQAQAVSTATGVPVPESMLLPPLAAVVAWAVPGAGHLMLKRPWRGLVFFGLVVLALVIGCSLHGRLPWIWQGSPLQVAATLGAMGSGSAFFVLRWALGYEGDLQAPGYDYGTAFILTAGLMNILLVLDAWDIALGRKK